jgi:hypothetical protein
MHVSSFEFRHWAAISGALSCAQQLEENGAKLDAKTTSGMTALHMAAENGRRPFVDWLLTKPGIPVEDKDNDGKTAADLAKDKGHKEIADVLSPPKGGCCVVM